MEKVHGGGRPGPWALVHGSMVRIKNRKGVHDVIILAIHIRMDGPWRLRPLVVTARQPWQ
jgi:hypothetical protein